MSVAAKPLPQVISRQAAHMQGLRRFFTGEPCKSGHTAERYVSNGACVSCVNTGFKYRANSFSHDLAPFASQRLWLPRSFVPEDLPALEKYLQRCIHEYTKHAGKLTEALDDAMRMQMERM